MQACRQEGYPAQRCAAHTEDLSNLPVSAHTGRVASLGGSEEARAGVGSVEHRRGAPDF